MKRGPKPKPVDQRLSVRVSVRLREDIADGMFSIAGRNRLTLSAIIQNYCERLLEKERRLVSDQIKTNPGGITH